MWTVPGYRDGRELGRGGSGRVVLSTHDGTGRPVAIKYLHGELVPGFRAEARLLVEVASPHIARLYEYLEADHGAAIVMELVDGVTLREVLRGPGPLSPESALSVLKGSLLALATAHGHGVVHRDYKPGNVLVDQAGQSTLVDFGIATRAGREVTVAGTPAYMAPEQWAGTPATVATDIYATTVTFFECLTGRTPYPFGGLPELRLQHEAAPIPVSEVPEPVRGLVIRGLAKDPAVRPADAATFLAELEVAARAGYGDDWERRGLDRLARRVALLALLLPTAAASVAGAAVAATVLGAGGGPGPSGPEPDPLGGDAGPLGGAPATGSGIPVTARTAWPRAWVHTARPGTARPRAWVVTARPGTPRPRAWVAPATAGVVLTIALVVAFLVPLRASAPVADTTARVSTVVTPTGLDPSARPPTPSPTPVPVPVPTPPIPVPGPPGPAPPTTNPPAPLVIHSISVASFAYQGETSTARATVTVSASGPGGFTVSVRYVGRDNTGQESTSPVVKTYQRSGATSYTVVSTFEVPCFWAYDVKVTASVGAKTSPARVLDAPFC